QLGEQPARAGVRHALEVHPARRRLVRSPALPVEERARREAALDQGLALGGLVIDLVDEEPIALELGRLLTGEIVTGEVLLRRQARVAVLLLPLVLTALGRLVLLVLVLFLLVVLASRPRRLRRRDLDHARERYPAPHRHTESRPKFTAGPFAGRQKFGL